MSGEGPAVLPKTVVHEVGPIHEELQLSGVRLGPRPKAGFSSRVAPVTTRMKVGMFCTPQRFWQCSSSGRKRQVGSFVLQCREYGFDYRLRSRASAGQYPGQRLDPLRGIFP